MNPDTKTKWIAALRSGEYKQGKGLLNCNGHYCCLGVLCEIAVKAGVAVATDRPGSRVGYKHKTENNIHSRFWSRYLSDGISEWAELSEDAGSKLAEMNDLENKSFDEIADWIEENL